MTPQERQLIDELFERLARVENAPRDREAAAAIAEGLRYAPNAVYTLVQTVLLQDEALKRADARIKELEAGPAPQQPEHGGSFLDTMRSTLFGGGEQPRSSVPNVRPNNDGGRPAWNTGQVLPQGGPAGGFGQGGMGQGGLGQGGLGQGGFGQGGGGPFGQQAAGGGGGSFLGTAAAAAAGVIGGSLLLSSIRGMMGGGEGGHQQSLADAQAGGGGGGPWGSSSGSGGDLARDAGLNDIGSSGGRGGEESSRAGLVDQGSYDQASYDDDPGFDDFDDGGDSDYA
ncbi:hypothetical protein BJ122_103114 [Rhodopseudomonas faecalis]|uniref:DUF2076 family protein n=1 Tax=Rhodopseudomonas faecalis TaxID=99655 RepID=A0A318THY6_9BRAD|nr:DUF2076 domain-containing protein [Rhodopseudomonas faecalis]PYF04461.1 hypothetical protein BJ122_103114 [Rhodopseudomonas faecalis]